MESSLTIPEEFYLLTINEKNGLPLKYDAKTFNITLAAAILVELSFGKRIDSDFENIIPDSPDTTGNTVLDIAIQAIHKEKKIREISFWILKFTEQANDFRDLIINSLVNKGVLKLENKKILWVFNATKYPLQDKEEQNEVRLRLKNLLKNYGEVPDLRDVALLSLLYYGGMLDCVFTEIELKRYKIHLKHFARMDAIGKAIGKALEEITLSYKLQSTAKQLVTPKTPEEKLDELIDAMRERHSFDDDEKLPDWLTKGTEQYMKTLEFIRENNTNNIVYNAKTKEYKVKKYQGSSHVFGSGT